MGARGAMGWAPLSLPPRGEEGETALPDQSRGDSPLLNLPPREEEGEPAGMQLPHRGEDKGAVNGWREAVPLFQLAGEPCFQEQGQVTQE